MARGVGGEHEERPGHSGIAEPQQPLGEGGPAKGRALADDAEGTAVGQHERGIERRSPEPPEIPHRPRGGGDGGGDPVDHGGSIQPLQQDAPPLRGDGVRAE